MSDKEARQRRVSGLYRTQGGIAAMHNGKHGISLVPVSEAPLPASTARADHYARASRADRTWRPVSIRLPAILDLVRGAWPQPDAGRDGHGSRVRRLAGR